MPPKVVQEANSPNRRNSEDQFVFVVCQHGLEPTIKQKWLAEGKSLRLAFSRPGLLTLKFSAPPPQDGKPSPELDQLLAQMAHDWPIRHAGAAICNLRGPEGGQLASQALQAAGTDWDAIHIFQRDPYLVGLKGFAPGPTLLTAEVAERVVQAGTNLGVRLAPVNQPCEAGARVLDILLVEPDQWLIGCHLAQTPQSCWPGGVIAITAPAEMISRAYLKMGEALAWSQLPIEPGDEVVEIGSAPGGSSQRLLDLGLRVTGIDPAEMDPLLTDHSRFTHWRTKSAGVKRRRFARFRWLVADANVAPNYTLDVVEDIVTYPTSRFEGLLLTLKLSSYALAENMQDYVKRIESWGFPRVEVRQLASNRRECCVVAERSAGQARRAQKANQRSAGSSGD